MVKQPDLKICPFCGTKPIIKATSHMRDGVQYQVQCSKCSGNTKKQTKYEAIEQWNRRIIDEIQIPNDN